MEAGIIITINRSGLVNVPRDPQSKKLMLETNVSNTVKLDLNE